MDSKKAEFVILLSSTSDNIRMQKTTENDSFIPKIHVCALGQPTLGMLEIFTDQIYFFSNDELEMAIYTHECYI